MALLGTALAAQVGEAVPPALAQTTLQVVRATGEGGAASTVSGPVAALAQEAGISDAEIRRVVAGPDAPGWSEHERALLRATDELHEDACIADGTWAELSAAYTVEQLIEVPMLVGQYHLVSFTLNSLGVQREPGVVGLPEVD